MGRTALITGASRGLGRALAEQLATDGWDVVIDAVALEAARARIAGAGGGAVSALAGDVDDPDHVAALVAASTATARNPLELVVNNAGTLGPEPHPLPSVQDLGAHDLERILRTNVVAPLRVVQAALPHLRASGGTLVNVTSDAAVEGYAGWGGYGTSKAALEQLSHVLAAEEPDIRTYWVDPGDMRTQMHQDAFPGEDISDRPTPEGRVPALVRLLADRPPSGRYRVADLSITDDVLTDDEHAEVTS